MEKDSPIQLASANQSVKIVPSIEESLQSMGLNISLDERSILWWQQLQTTWKTWKKSETVEQLIETYFQSIRDPFRVTLIFITQCITQDCKPKTLPYFVVETLQKWSKNQELSPEESIKSPAFYIAIQQRNPSFLNLIAHTYQLSTIKQVILPKIKEMIKNDNCKLASQIVMALDLYEDIPVEDLLFPLILQDKNNIIDEYLTTCPSQVKPLLFFLDNLLNKSFKLRDYIQSYLENNQISQIRYEKLHHKPLGKLVARLCSKFNIPIETCKNLSKNRTAGGLRYLIHQKYTENNISSTVWDDLVKDSLRQNVEAANEFIEMLSKYDKNEALKWIDYLNIGNEELPTSLKAISLEHNNDESHDIENWDTESSKIIPSQEYYKFTLTRDCIIIIDNGEKFYDMLNSIKMYNVVSIDCEWKPSFGAVQSQVALIQIATFHNVYLIDTLIVNKQEYSSFWYTFNKSFMENGEVIKLGLGLEQDLKEMKASINGLGKINVKGEGLLDLSLLWKNIINNGLVIPGCCDSIGNGLSSIVQSCFGLPLEKSEQCSNWELRPLRETQIIYAALDAHVLLQVYDFLQKMCVQQNINFEDIVNETMHETKKKLPKKTKVIDRLQFNLCSIEPKFVNDVKFLVEPTLSHLMAYLRYCGLDTIVVPGSLQWHDVVNWAISDDRLVLVDKLKCSPTQDFPQNSILNVGNDTIVKQLQKIFENFNIKIRQTDLLRLCVKCNSNDIKKLSLNEIKKICDDYINLIPKSTLVNTYLADFDDEDASYENFLSDSDGDGDILQPVQNSYCPKPKSCLTSKGAAIEISNPQGLVQKNKPAVLCEYCGQMYWDEDDLFKSISDIICQITNFTVW